MKRIAFPLAGFGLVTSAVRVDDAKVEVKNDPDYKVIEKTHKTLRTRPRSSRSRATGWAGARSAPPRRASLTIGPASGTTRRPP